jgi:hypothetical protein
MARELLEKLADLVLVCRGGEEVRACTFTMLSTCPVLLPCSHSRSIDITAMRADVVRVAVDVIHGITRVRDLSLDDLDKCAQAFDFFGCTILRDSLTRAMWKALQTRDLDVWRDHAQRFMDSPGFRQQFVHTYGLRTRKFGDVHDLLAVLDVSHDSARTLITVLSDSFQVLRLFFGILEAFPSDHLTETIALDLLSIENLHARFHPEEFAIALKRITRIFPDGSPSLKSYVGANQMYNAAPVPNSLTATVLTYPSPRTSVLVKVYNPFRGTKTLNINNWCRLALDASAGTLAGRFSLTRLHRDNPVQIGDTCNVRMTSMSICSEHGKDLIDDDLDIEETWAVFGGLSDVYWIDFSPQFSEEFRATLCSPGIRYVRLDFFYAA